MFGVLIFCSVCVGFVASASAAEYELKWDDGTAGAVFCCANRGEGYWVGNDFDVRMLCARDVRRLRVYVYDGTNRRWDGFRVALFAFGRVPGSIIWPASGVPKFVRPSVAGRFTWAEVRVDWTLPGGTTKFLAAQEQFYLYPNNDDYCFDGDGVRGRTWRKGPGSRWERLEQPNLGNLMVRAVVADFPAVAPASLGRVKALYR